MQNHLESSGTRILLVRHGETEWNRLHRFQGRSDLPLNQKGTGQGHALALALKDEPITAIYSSPLIRAMEMANLIKVFHPSVPLFEEEGLREMDLGEYEGMEAQRWSSQNDAFYRSWLESPASVRIPGGENLLEVQDRAICALKRITQLHPPGSTLVLCSHNFVNRTLLCYALKMPLDRFREVKQETGALNILCKQGEKLVVKVMNECCHLTEDIESGQGSHSGKEVPGSSGSR